MADEKSKTTDTKASKADKDLAPQELEARKAANAAQAEESKQRNIRELIKSKKYFLPIRK